MKYSLPILKNKNLFIRQLTLPKCSEHFGHSAATMGGFEYH